MNKKSLILKAAVAMLAFSGFGVASNFANSVSVYAMDMAGFDFCFSANMNIKSEYEKEAQQIINSFTIAENAAKSFCNTCSNNTIQAALATSNLILFNKNANDNKKIQAKQNIINAFKQTVCDLKYNLHNITDYIKKCIKFLEKLKSNLNQYDYLGNLYNQLKVKFKEQTLDLINIILKSNLPFEEYYNWYYVAIYDNAFNKQEKDLYADITNLFNLCKNKLKINEHFIDNLINSNWAKKMNTI